MSTPDEFADKSQLRCYADNAGDGIYVIDLPSGRIISCNRQACLDSGYPQDELLRLRVTDIDVNFRPSQIDEIHGQMTPGKPILVESVHKRKDGSTYPVEIRLNLLDKSDPVHIISIVRNITERRMTEEKLRESEARFRFFAGMFVRYLGLRELKGLFSAKVEVRKDHNVISTGIYGFIRHPLYLGTLIMSFAAVVYYVNILSVIMMVLSFAGVALRINKEEKYLQANLIGYSDYMKQTKRLLPYIF